MCPRSWRKCTRMRGFETKKTNDILNTISVLAAENDVCLFILHIVFILYDQFLASMLSKPTLKWMADNHIQLIHMGRKLIPLRKTFS